jgi:hypothetical protein
MLMIIVEGDRPIYIHPLPERIAKMHRHELEIVFPFEGMGSLGRMVDVGWMMTIEHLAQLLALIT